MSLEGPWEAHRAILKTFLFEFKVSNGAATVILLTLLDQGHLDITIGAVLLLDESVGVQKHRLLSP